MKNPIFLAKDSTLFSGNFVRIIYPEGIARIGDNENGARVTFPSEKLL
jgi:hypothetical protein